MKKIKVVVIGINFSDESTRCWEELKSWSFLKGTKIHIVHCSRIPKQVHYNSVSSLYPPSEQFVLIENSIQLKLGSVAKAILPETYFEEVTSKCILSDNPKKSFCDYVKLVNGDLVILGTESKKMPFGSFIQYQSLHSPANIMMLKHKEG